MQHPIPSVDYIKENQVAVHHRRARITLIAGIIAVCITTAAYIVWKYRTIPPMTPEETLQALEASSLPVTTTPQEQATQLTDLSEVPQRVIPATTIQQLDILEKLGTQ